MNRKWLFRVVSSAILGSLCTPWPLHAAESHIVTGQCVQRSAIAEGPIGSDLRKVQSRFYCDTAVVTFLDARREHVAVQFSKRGEHHGRTLAYAGWMEPDGQILDVERVYFEIGEPTQTNDGACRFFFDKRGDMTAIVCGAKVDEDGRRTVGVIEFHAKK